MSRDQSFPMPGEPLNVEAIQQFWAAVLQRLKVRAEAADPQRKDAEGPRTDSS